jgi:uncharacterized protein
MRTHSSLVVDVSQLLEAPGSRRALEFSAPVEGLEGGLVGVAEPLRFVLTLEAVEGGILVQGSIAGTYTAMCRRCLKPVAKDFDVRVADVYRPAGDVWEEGYVVTHGTIDLERIVRDTVGLDLPINPICRPDCMGLCPRCGADLNEGPCDCPPDVDPRWSALRELGGDGKTVS